MLLGGLDVFVLSFVRLLKVEEIFFVGLWGCVLAVRGFCSLRSFFFALVVLGKG